VTLSDTNCRVVARKEVGLRTLVATSHADWIVLTRKEEELVRADPGIRREAIAMPLAATTPGSVRTV